MIPPPVGVVPGDARWEGLRDELADRGTVVLHGRGTDWRQADSHPFPAPRLLSGDAASARPPASRRLIAEAAEQLLGVDPRRLELARTPSGRPALRGVGRCDLSLSHTGELLVLALSLRGRVGVDAEHTGRRVGAALPDFVCTAHERAALPRSPADARNRAVLRLWTLKEAYTKALGVGRALPASSFGFAVGDALGDRGAALLDVDGSPAVVAHRWRFTTDLTGSGHLVSTALREGG